METYERLRQKLRTDRVFLLASAVAFNGLLTAVPVLLLTAWALGAVAAGSSSARLDALELLLGLTPLSPAEAREVLGDIVAERTWIGVIGAITLVWTSTRLSTSLRQVLEVVFEIPEDARPGWLRGKLHDARLLVLGGTLFLLTAVSSSALHWAGGWISDTVGLVDPPGAVWAALAIAIGLVISIGMFFAVYRFVPGRRVKSYDAAVAAVFAGVLFEMAKHAFIIWLPYSRHLDLYGPLADLVAAALWAYYSALVFVTGAEISSARRSARALEAVSEG